MQSTIRICMHDLTLNMKCFQAELIASHRSFVSKCEVMELTNNLSNRDDTLMLYLFTDYMEICKVRKSRAFNTAKSPTGNKTYKHIQLIPLSAIPCVYDIKDSPRAFAISINDELYSFNINDEMEKICYLKSLCKQLAENACRADAVSDIILEASSYDFRGVID